MRKSEKEAYAVRLVVNLMCHRRRQVRQKDENGNPIPLPPQPDPVDVALEIVDKIAKHSDEHWGPEEECGMNSLAQALGLSQGMIDEDALEDDGPAPEAEVPEALASR